MLHAKSRTRVTLTGLLLAGALTGCPGVHPVGPGPMWLGSPRPIPSYAPLELEVTPAFPTFVVGESLRLETRTNAKGVTWGPPALPGGMQSVTDQGVVTSQWAGYVMANGSTQEPYGHEVWVLVAAVDASLRDRAAPILSRPTHSESLPTGPHYVQTAEAWAAFGREVAPGEALPAIDFEKDVALAHYFSHWVHGGNHSLTASAPQLVGIDEIDQLVKLVRPEASRKFMPTMGSATVSGPAVFVYRVPRAANGLGSIVYSLADSKVPDMQRHGAWTWYPGLPAPTPSPR